MVINQTGCTWSTVTKEWKFLSPPYRPASYSYVTDKRSKTFIFVILSQSLVEIDFNQALGYDIIRAYMIS